MQLIKLEYDLFVSSCWNYEKIFMHNNQTNVLKKNWKWKKIPNVTAKPPFFLERETFFFFSKHTSFDYFNQQLVFLLFSKASCFTLYWLRSLSLRFRAQCAGKTTSWLIPWEERVTSSYDSDFRWNWSDFVSTIGTGSQTQAPISKSIISRLAILFIYDIRELKFPLNYASKMSFFFFTNLWYDKFV